MPRATELKFDTADFRMAMDYALSTMPKVLGISLEDKGNYLLNPASKATYSLFLSPGISNQEISLAVKQDGTVLHSVKSAWIALLNAGTSVLYLIPTDKFVAFVAQALANNYQFQGLKIDSDTSGDWLLCKMNMGWAEANGLFLRSFKLDSKGAKSFLFFRGMKLKSPEKMVHLHVHTYYSMLDGVSSPDELVEQAMLAGQPALAVTDHGNMYGTFKLWQSCKDVDFAVKPIFGVEAYVVDDVRKKYIDKQGNTRRFEYHQTLLAMNQEGWENLCELVSIASRDNFYYVPRIDHGALFKYSAGIICLTGCFKGMVSHHLQQHDPTVNADCPWYSYNPDWSRTVLREYKKHFGDRLYGEVQNIPFPRYMDAVPRMLQMFEEEGVPAIPTNDVHYAQTKDAVLQSLMTKINSNRADEIGEDRYKAGPYFIKTRDEMAHSLFTDVMFDRTVEVAERCKVSMEFTGYLFPSFAMENDCDWPAFIASRKAR